MCDKAVSDFLYLALLFLIKKSEMCDRVISDDPFLIVYCPDKHETHRMRDKADDDCLTALKFVPDWFVKIKMIKKLLHALYTDDHINYFNEDSCDVIFYCNEMGIVGIDLNNIDLEDTNYNEDDPKTIIHITLLAWHIKFEKRKALKKELNKELMLIACHPGR